MQEIRCPHCNKVFTIDDSGYEEIVRQVRNKEFEKDLNDRLELISEKKNAEIKQAKSDTALSYQAQISEKDKEIERLNGILSKNIADRELAVRDALEAKNRELLSKDTEIAKLNGEINSIKSETELKLKDKDDHYQQERSMLEGEIERLKNFKLSLSTKSLGESLEVYCHNKFNEIRMTSFPNDYFEKDNDSASGTKGDFVYRAKDENGNEFLSIMFEMKNEADATGTKHKNEDFFRKLNKDRNEKKCEYAVLVSMLEADNDFYNNGIADVSYRYPKMFVVRPQFFIPIISLLRNASKNSLSYKKELEDYRKHEVDVTGFESKLNEFKDGFLKDLTYASDRFDDFEKEIDKAISSLNKAKEDMQKMKKHFNAANNKLEDLTIRRLTNGNPTMKAKFDECRATEKAEG